MRAIGFRGVALGLALFAGMAATALSGERVLHIFTWSDYFDPDVLEQFEEEQNCRISIDYFDSNEAMYAKLRAGGGGYDIITPSSYMTSIMNKQGMLMPLEHDKLPNLRHIDRSFTAFTEDPKMRHSVPYTRTVAGVGYDSIRVREEDLGSWNIFGNAAYARRMTMLNDMRETIGAALKYLGYSLNSTDADELEKAREQLSAWKRNIAKFDVDEAKIGLGAGEFLVIHGYNGDVALIMEDNPDIGFYIPREGASLAVDDFVVSMDSPNSNLAHAFIDYMMDPEIAARTMESIRYFMPNPEAVAMLDEELRENPAFAVSPEILANCEVIRDLGEKNELYIRIWDRVKAED